MRAAGKWTTPGAAASGKRALVDVKDRDAREAVRLEIGGAGQSVRGGGTRLVCLFDCFTNSPTGRVL